MHYNLHIGAGLSLNIIDRWIDGLLIDLRNHFEDDWPDSNQPASLIEDINFHTKYQPEALS